MAFAEPPKIIKQFSVGWGWTVADFGAGPGAYVYALAEAVGPEGQVYAIDIRREVLNRVANEAAERGIENITVITGDIEEPRGSGLDDGEANAAVASAVLFQFEDKVAGVREIVRTVRKNGRILVVDWDETSTIGPPAKARVSMKEARRLFEDAGCVYERSINAGEQHYGIIFKKARSE